MFYLYIYFYVELNLSNNQISNLPDEIVEMTQLKKMDLSKNSFVTLPR
jgi:Leucine-rich repeat (LRR) protein